MAALVTLSLLAPLVVGLFGPTGLAAPAAPDGMVRENFSDAVERELTSRRGRLPGPW